MQSARRLVISGGGRASRSKAATLIASRHGAPLVAWAEPATGMDLATDLRQTVTEYLSRNLSVSQIQNSQPTYVLDGLGQREEEASELALELASREPQSRIIICGRFEGRLLKWRHLELPDQVDGGNDRQPLLDSATESALCALSSAGGPFNVITAGALLGAASTTDAGQRLELLERMGLVDRWHLESRCPMYVLADAIMTSPTPKSAQAILVRHSIDQLMERSNNSPLFLPQRRDLAWFSLRRRSVSAALSGAVNDAVPNTCQLATLAAPYWIALGTADAFLDLVAQLSEDGIAPTTKAALAYWRGRANYSLARFEQAAVWYRRSANLFQSIDLPRLSAAALLGEATAYQQMGAAARLSAVLAVAYSPNPSVDQQLRPYPAASMLRCGYSRYLAGDSAGAIADLGRALSLARIEGDDRTEATALTNLGEASVTAGQLAVAEDVLEAAASLWSELGDVLSWTSNLEAIALLRSRQGRLSDAARLVTIAATIYRRTFRDPPTDIFEIAALVASDLARHELAVFLSHFATARRTLTGDGTCWSEEPPLASSAYAKSASLLGARRLRAAIARAQHSRVSEALSALASLDLDPRVHQGLSDREADVVRHLRKGLSTKEIASELGISGRTVEAHLYRISKKLHAKGRLALALAFPDTNLPGPVDRGVPDVAPRSQL